MRVLACRVHLGSYEKCGWSWRRFRWCCGRFGAFGDCTALRPDLEVVPAAQLVDFFWWPHDFGNVALDVRGIPPRLGGRKGSYFAQASGKSSADPFDGLLRQFVQTYQRQRDCRPYSAYEMSDDLKRRGGHSAIAARSTRQSSHTSSLSNSTDWRSPRSSGLPFVCDTSI